MLSFCSTFYIQPIYKFPSVFNFPFYCQPIQNKQFPIHSPNLFLFQFIRYRYPPVSANPCFYPRSAHIYNPPFDGIPSDQHWRQASYAGYQPSSHRLYSICSKSQRSSREPAHVLVPNAPFAEPALRIPGTSAPSRDGAVLQLVGTALYGTPGAVPRQPTSTFCSHRTRHHHHHHPTVPHPHRHTDRQPRARTHHLSTGSPPATSHPTPDRITMATPLRRT